MRNQAGKVPRPIVVIKRNHAGEETWRYPGTVLSQRPAGLLVEARFNRSDLPFMGVVLRRDDRFLETYFTRRWYNVFEIHDRDDGLVKGWYCNITRPAVLERGDTLSYVDLALDLWVAADGNQTVLDRDEFAALDLAPVTQARALAALEELQTKFRQKGAPGLE